MAFHPMPRCPRCGAIAKMIDPETVRVNEWETITFTHRCTVEKCNTPFRHEPPDKMYFLKETKP